MNKTKIEWCDSTWNPVTGCLHKCKYCYARRIAERFRPFDFPHTTTNGVLKGIIDLATPIITECKDGKERVCAYPYGFEPTFHRYRLAEPQNQKKPQTIFVCSMADLFGDWVPDNWIEEVFAACRKAPQHRYLFLTKNSKRYKINGYVQSENFWYGISITKEKEMYLYNYLPACAKRFVSIEPLLEDLQPEKHDLLFKQVHWIIIGAETGNSKSKVTPKKDWIEHIVECCNKYNRPVFMKDSLIPIVGENNMRREFPWDYGRLKKSQTNVAQNTTQDILMSAT